MRFWKQKRRSDCQISIDDTGFRLIGSSSDIRWRDVISIAAFKRDLLTTDLICLEFEVKGVPFRVEVNEEMGGFAELMSALSAQFPEIDAAWYGKVMQPAFATNYTVLIQSPQH